ncbi:MAG: polysaccharide deacetylase family protein, partial [Tistlia sp.]
MSLKRSLRAGLHGLGGYGLYHRLRNRDRLTVAMFHRVLPQADPRFAESDPAYTVSLARFEDYLDFFARHYAVVDYADLAGRRPLPPRPLLITFDDGWADTVEVALPALRRRGWNALVFVAGCAV